MLEKGTGALLYLDSNFERELTAVKKKPKMPDIISSGESPQKKASDIWELCSTVSFIF